MPFFHGQFYFFSLFKLYPLVKKMCEETDAMSIVFSDLNLGGIYLDL